MALWRLYYHLVWATKERQPFITTKVEADVYAYIAGKIETNECLLHALNGMPDHLHVVVSISPKIAIADFVKNIKGSSAYHITHNLPNPIANFSWQRGYGVFSFGQSQLEIAVNYVQNQKAHHSEGKTITYLERESEQENKPTIWKEQ